MADQTRGRKIGDEVLDELLAGQDPAEAFRSGTLIDDLKKAVAERALDAEMEAHLEREGEQDAGNHRNGHNRKRVLTDAGAMDLEVPRDRHGRFEPQLVERYARRLPGFDEKVISMYARGMPTPVPAGQVGDPGPRRGAVRAVGVAGAGLEGDRRRARLFLRNRLEIREWQSRPLEDVYAVVYFDAIRVRRPLPSEQVRDEGLVKNKNASLLARVPGDRGDVRGAQGGPGAVDRADRGRAVLVRGDERAEGGAACGTC